MDTELLKSLGIDAGIILALLVAAQGFKKGVLQRRGLKQYSPKWLIKRYKKIPVLILVIGGILGAVAVTRPLEWQALLGNAIKYVCYPSGVYAVGGFLIGKKT